MDEQPPKRRGRPRKVVPDALSSQEVSQLPEHDDPNGPDGSEPDQGSDSQTRPAFEFVPARRLTFDELAVLAHTLSLQGHLVTQIHHREQAPEIWRFGDIGAATHSGADADYVVTSDGVRHTP